MATELGPKRDNSRQERTPSLEGITPAGIKTRVREFFKGIDTTQSGNHRRDMFDILIDHTDGVECGFASIHGLLIAAYSLQPNGTKVYSLKGEVKLGEQLFGSTTVELRLTEELGQAPCITNGILPLGERVAESVIAETFGFTKSH